MLGCAEDTSKNFVECDLGPDVPKWEWHISEVNYVDIDT